MQGDGLCTARAECMSEEPRSEGPGYCMAASEGSWRRVFPASAPPSPVSARIYSPISPLTRRQTHIMRALVREPPRLLAPGARSQPLSAAACSHGSWLAPALLHVSGDDKSTSAFQPPRLHLISPAFSSPRRRIQRKATRVSCLPALFSASSLSRLFSLRLSSQISCACHAELALPRVTHFSYLALPPHLTCLSQPRLLPVRYLADCLSTPPAALSPT